MSDHGQADACGVSTGGLRTDPRWGDSVAALVERIRDDILASPRQRITFARFMRRALTEPGLGYYDTSAQRPTREGDFLTAPELHPFFGRCVGRQLTELWERLGSPERFVVQEWGAGRGTLATSVAAGLHADGSGLAEALLWQPIDLPGRHPEPAVGPFTGAVLANEYLDALPVHRVERRDGQLLERYVTWQDGWFAERPGPVSSPELTAELAADGVTLADGQLAEIRPGIGQWLTTATNELVAGALLVIDYGHPASVLYGPRRMAGTLVTYRDHQAGDDPFQAVGHSDITTHVDLTALARAADAAGLAPLGETSQAEFLASLGLGDMLGRMGLDPATDGGAYLLARSSVARLLDPRHLGAFRVLLYGRGLAQAPALKGLSIRIPR